MGDIRAESRGGMDDVYRENMDLRVSNRRRKRDDGEIQIARDGRCPMFLTIIDNKVTVKVARSRNGNSTFCRKVSFVICPFQSFCRSLEDKIKEIKLESSGEHLIFLKVGERFG